MPFWRNPEFLRHTRAQLRPARALTLGLVMLVICFLLGLLCWNASDTTKEFVDNFYRWLMGIQFVVLGFWTASACGEAITRERELKTYDFLKTTRLTAGEMLVGKLTGAPISGYFAVGCSLPISLILGVMAGYSAAVLALTYLLLFCFTLFVGLAALWLSMMLERSSAVAVGVLILLPLGIGNSFASSAWPGFAAASVLPALLPLYGGRSFQHDAGLFGRDMPYIVLAPLLYAAIGFWLVLMLVQNLKRDLDEIRLLSRWQAVGLLAFLNLLIYAFFDTERLRTFTDYRSFMPRDLGEHMVILNAAFLFMIGLFMLTPHERLKVWWRRKQARQAGLLDRDGLVWPWILLCAVIGYTMLVFAVAALAGRFPVAQWALPQHALLLAACTAFVIRDVLFLQWCMLTRMTRPVVKGAMYLMLYYAGVMIMALVFKSGTARANDVLLSLLTPFPLMDAAISPNLYIYAGIALQAAISYVLVRAITERLSRPALAGAAAAAA